METDTYAIKTTVFEGPFAVLLGLIEQRKLSINDLSLAEVTEDYLKYINTKGLVDPAQVSSFVAVAATLILIKSKSLLPNLDLTSEEESDIHNLEERLRLYELFSKASADIKLNFGKRIIFAPLERKHETVVFLPDSQITRESMMTFAVNVLDRIPKKVKLSEVEVKKVISIEEMIDNLTERIKTSLKMGFREFTGVGGQKQVTKEEKVLVIVGFLAMLELVRQGILNATQEGEGDIIIEHLQAAENTQ